MVQRVLPFGIVAPLLNRPQISDLHLRDDERAGVDRLHTPRELREDVRVGLVEDSVRGVEA
jgi:hypothetical protein